MAQGTQDCVQFLLLRRQQLVAVRDGVDYPADKGNVCQLSEAHTLSVVGQSLFSVQSGPYSVLPRCHRLKYRGGIAAAHLAIHT